MATKIVNTTQKVDSVKFSLNYENIFGKHKLNIADFNTVTKGKTDDKSKDSDKLSR